MGQTSSSMILSMLETCAKRNVILSLHLQNEAGLASLQKSTRDNHEKNMWKDAPETNSQ